MDIEEFREALTARERFAPDEQAVLDAVLANPPKVAARRPRRLFAAVGIAAAVVLIAGTVTLLRSTTRTSSIAGPVPGPTVSSVADPLRARLIGSDWSIATITKGPAGVPVSAGRADVANVDFIMDGTLSVSDRCASGTVEWATAGPQITIEPIIFREHKCAPNLDTSQSAGAVPLAAAFEAMKTKQTTGHLEGQSLVLKVDVYVLVFRFDESLAYQPTTSPTDPIGYAAPKWADFPILARPRPVVLMTSAVIRPPDPLPKGNDENALAAGRIKLAIAPPPAPDGRNGYRIMSVRTAVGLVADPQQTASTKSFVHIIGVRLVDHVFDTDRGKTSLPTWEMMLAESTDPIYVLAVAATGRFPATLADSPPSGQDGVLSGAGRDVTIHFVAHHVSTGHCDPDWTSTFTSRESAAVVVMAVDVRLDPGFPKPGCEDGYYDGYTDLGPGSTDTKTLHLTRPLGNRVVVNASGVPYVITTAG